MITKIEKMNMKKENPKADLDTTIMVEPQEELEKVLL
jgi:hypothetical protein